MNESFTKIPMILYEDNLLSPRDIIMISLLISNASQKGYAFGNNKYYANKLHCSERTISSIISKLCRLNYIQTFYKTSFRRKIFVSPNKEFPERKKMVSMLMDNDCEHNK